MSLIGPLTSFTALQKCGRYRINSGQTAPSRLTASVEIDPQRTSEHMAFSNCRPRWTSCKCQHSCGKRRGGVVRPRLFVDRELYVGQTRKACLSIENAQARDDSALRKRRDGEARERRGAQACPAR